MIKRISSIIIVIVSIACAMLTACVKNESLYNESATTVINRTENDNTLSENRITFMIPPTAYIDDNMVTELNRYLADMGCDYTVDFIFAVNNVEDFWGLTVEDYYEIISSYNGLDLVCYTNTINDSNCSIYNRLLDEDKLYRLDEFMETDSGRNLKACMSDVKWQSLYTDDHLYGVNGYPCSVIGTPAYVVNKKLLEKYGVTDDEFENEEKMSAVLQKIQESEGKDFYSLYITDEALELGGFDGWYGFDLEKIPGIGTDLNGNVCSIFEVKGFKEYTKTVDTILKNNHINVFRGGNEQISYEQFFMSPMSSCGFSFIMLSAFLSGFSDADKLSIDDFTVIRPYGERYIMRTKMSRVSVMNDSDNKECALDFLNRLYSDAYISNLMIYGTNYHLENEIVVNAQNEPLDRLIQAWFFANEIITDRMYYEPVNKLQAYEELYAKAYVISQKNVDFEQLEIADEQKVCLTILNGFKSRLLLGEAEDFEVFYDNYAKLYCDGGGDKLKEAVSKMKE